MVPRRRGQRRHKLARARMGGIRRERHSLRMSSIQAIHYRNFNLLLEMSSQHSHNISEPHLSLSVASECWRGCKQPLASELSKPITTLITCATLIIQSRVSTARLARSVQRNTLLTAHRSQAAAVIAISALVCTSLRTRFTDDARPPLPLWPPGSPHALLFGNRAHVQAGPE